MQEGWKSYKIGDVCSRIYSGGTPSTANKSFWNGDIPWLSSGETRNRYIYSAEKSITQSGLNKSSAKRALKGSTVIASAGQGKTRGQTSYLKIDTTINQSIICFEPNSKVVDGFFLFFNLSDRYDEYRRISDAFSIRGSLTIDLLKTQIKLTIPPLQEQRAIASILSALDDKIELNLQMNKTLEEMAMALYKHWFVDFGPFQNGEFVDSELGMIPKGWEVKKLPKISVSHNNKRKPISTRERAKIQGSYPYYGATKILDYIDDYRFDGEYILLAEDGTVKTEKDTPYLQFIEGQFWVSNHAHVLTGKNVYSNEFLYLCLSNTCVTPIITGAVQLKISKQNLERLSFITPNNTQLETFQGMIIPMFKQIRSLLREVQTLTTLRDTLLPKLISGEVRVKDIEKTVATML